MPRPAVATVSTRATPAQRVRGQFGRRPGQVGLVEDHNGRYAAARKRVEDGLLERAPLPGIDDDQPQVGAVEDLAGLPHPLLPQGTHVVDAGGVDEEHRSQRQQFHGLFHGIGGGAGHGGNDGDLLPGQGIQQRRLAGVAAAEQADVQAETLGGRLHGSMPRTIREPARQLGKRSALPSGQTRWKWPTLSVTNISTSAAPCGRRDHRIVHCPSRQPLFDQAFQQCQVVVGMNRNKGSGRDDVLLNQLSGHLRRNRRGDGNPGEHCVEFRQAVGGENELKRA